MAASDTNLVYDRETRALSAPDAATRRRVRLLQLTHRALQPVGHLGVSRVFALINTLLPTRADITIREGSWRFRFPADDYYWNRLLDPVWQYEPEIHAFLEAIRGLHHTFVDLGANFGYWSTRVAAGLYGARPLVAVEASSACFHVLRRNLECVGAEARALRYAVAERTGDEVPLFGVRHAGFSIDPSWAGRPAVVADTVPTITLDDALVEAGVEPAETPLVVKLDVEGAERAVLIGAPITVSGPSVFLMEDAAGPGRLSDAVEYAHHEAGMRLFALHGEAVPRRISGPDGVLRLKRRHGRLQRRGLNIAATGSPWWWEVLDRLGRGPGGEPA
jgi:FkbM family methyltransferase